MRTWMASALILGLVLHEDQARADDGSASAAGGATIAPGRRARGVGAALVPGVIVHGPGAWVVGKKTTAKKLALVSGAGLLGVITGGALLALTEASRRTTGPLAAMTVASFGVFSTSFLADLYAVLAPECGTGEPQREVPWLESSTSRIPIECLAAEHALHPKVGLGKGRNTECGTTIG